MTFDPERHRRVSHRRRGHDYTEPGYYFLTVCVEHRECLFGSVRDAQVELSTDGAVVDHYLRACCAGFANIVLDEYVVMPNHIHILLGIAEGAKHSLSNENRGQGYESANAWPLQTVQQAARGTTAGSIGAVVQNLKSITARRINARRGLAGTRLWQRDYHDHIVRDEAELDRIRQYIRDNPARWAEDRENPSHHE